MTEVELYRLLAQPAVFVLLTLFLVKARWELRLMLAAAVAVFSLAMGFLGIWAVRAGAPSWFGWMAVPAGMLFLSVVLWIRQRSIAAFLVDRASGLRPARRNKEVMVKHPIAGFRLAHAVVLRDAGKNAEAKKSAEKAFRTYGVEAPSVRAPVLLNAFYADLCERTGAVEVAYEAARTAIVQINEINAGKRQGSPESAENQWFILYWMRFVLSRLSPYVDSAAWELALAIPADYSKLDLPSTSSTLKSVMFPFERKWAIEADLAIEQARKTLSA